MKIFSNARAAKKLGISAMSLGRYVQAGKIPRPQTLRDGSARLYFWTEEEIDRVRKLLPKIANGRKTRYQKLREKQGTQPRAAALSTKRRTKKKK